MGFLSEPCLESSGLIKVFLGFQKASIGLLKDQQMFQHPDGFVCPDLTDIAALPD